MDWLRICTGGIMVKLEVIEQYGYNKQGVCINPFGVKPLWVQKLAERIRCNHVVTTAEEAPF
jgi:hypothetical protein